MSGIRYAREVGGGQGRCHGGHPCGLVHLTLGLKGSVRDAAWQRERWLKKVEGKAPALAELAERGTAGGLTLTILSRLRNTIHGEALRGVRVSGPGFRRLGTLLQMPKADEPDLLDAFSTLGGEDAWGVRWPIEPFYVNPDVLLDMLLAHAIWLLNEIIASTPFESLPFVQLSATDQQAPTAVDSPFVLRNRRSVRWQLGL